MKKHGIPGTYDGLHRNIMRESCGNPNAINNWDINAINGVPSIGLLQVIKPTFDAYHVAGTVQEPVRPGRQHHRRGQLRGRPVRLDRQRQQRLLSAPRGPLTRTPKGGTPHGVPPFGAYA